MRKRTNEFSKGDLCRARRKNDNIPHIWVILKDCKYGHNNCTRAFNFSSFNTDKQGEHMIDVSHYDFSPDLFKYKKDHTYARTNPKDCLKKSDILEDLGNIEQRCPGLMDEICKKIYSCEVAPDFKEICECCFRTIDIKIELNLTESPSCDCVR